MHRPPVRGRPSFGVRAERRGAGRVGTDHSFARRKPMQRLLSLLGRFVARRQVQPCKRQGGFRPLLEHLEDRVVPSTSGVSYLYVTSPADAGKGTLRDAILNANKQQSGKVYEIDVQVPGTISLKSSLPDLANAIIIKGLGSDKTLIQR